MNWIIFYWSCTWDLTSIQNVIRWFRIVILIGKTKQIWTLFLPFIINEIDWYICFASTDTQILAYKLILYDYTHKKYYLKIKTKKNLFNVKTDYFLFISTPAILIFYLVFLNKIQSIFRRDGRNEIIFYCLVAFFVIYFWIYGHIRKTKHLKIYFCKFHLKFLDNFIRFIRTNDCIFGLKLNWKNSKVRNNHNHCSTGSFYDISKEFC